MTSPHFFTSLLALSLFACGGDDSETPNGSTADGAPPSADAGTPGDVVADGGLPPSDAGIVTSMHQIEIRAGEASVLLRATDIQGNGFEDLNLNLYSATITLRGADGEVLRTVTENLGTQGINGPGWVKTFWWPANPLPSEAEVTLFERLPAQPAEAAMAVRTETIAIEPIPVVEDQCSPEGFDNRCSTGRGCLVDEAGLGTCHPLDVHVWEHIDDRFMDPMVAVDVRAERIDARLNIEVFMLAEDALTRVLLRIFDGGGRWRAAARGPAPTGPFSFFFGPHLYSAEMAIEMPPNRALDEACDPARFADRCVEGTSCSDADVCAISTPPVLESLTPYYDDENEILAVTFTGRDLEQDVARLGFELLPADGGEPEVLVADLRTGQVHPTLWGYGQLDYAEDGTFTGLWYATRDEDVVPNFRLNSEIPARSRLRMLITDIERQTSGEPLEATILPALPPTETAAGTPCDLSRVLNRCAEGSFCALAQSERSARCHVAPAECDGPWEIQPFTPPMVEGDLTEGPDVTIGYCSRQRGNLGAEQVYRYVPEATGTHTFRFTGQVATLFIRRHCTLRGAPESEFACVRAEQVGSNASQESVSLDAELEAGVPVYLFMESAWYGGGPYTLSVDTP